MPGVSAQHTSVPRWQDRPPVVDPSGHAFLVVSGGTEARTVADRWLAVIGELSRPVQSIHGENGAAWLAAQLAQARVGVRVMLAGPELDVLDQLRTARAAGAIDAEIRMYVTEARQRRVYCPHCREQTRADVGVGEVVPCGGCGRRLIVYHHVARAHGAYLGYMVDAEEPAA